MKTVVVVLSAVVLAGCSVPEHKSTTVYHKHIVVTQSTAPARVITVPAPTKTKQGFVSKVKQKVRGGKK